MKKIVMVIVAVALIAAGVFGTLAVQRTFEPSISLSSTSIQEQLSDCSELATAKLDYRGLVRYENGDIDFITKKAFTMVYDAEVRAGVDLAQARVEVSGNAITVSLPAPQLLGIEIDPELPRVLRFIVRAVQLGEQARYGRGAEGGAARCRGQGEPG